MNSDDEKEINLKGNEPRRESKKQWQMLMWGLFACRPHGWGINNTILISKIVRLPPSSCWAGHHRRWAMVEFGSDCFEQWLHPPTLHIQTKLIVNCSKQELVKPNQISNWHGRGSCLGVDMIPIERSVPVNYYTRPTFPPGFTQNYHLTQMKTNPDVPNCFVWWLCRRSNTSPAPPRIQSQQLRAALLPNSHRNC